MKVSSITAVSILALMMTGPAYAADVSATGVSGSATVSAGSKDGPAMTDAKAGLSKASAEMRETADDIKAFLVGKAPDAKLEPVLIHRDTTAHGVIGATIVNGKGDKLATVKDIIVNAEGKATLVVVSDDGLLGIGSKVAAFDYNKVIAQQPDGKVLMVLSQEMIDHASDFSYDPADWAKAKIIPAGSISTNALLKGNVLDSNGKKVASVENINFRGADASQIIVGFDKTLGLGGELAALEYEDLEMVRKDGNIDFRLTSNQTAQFKSFKKSVAN